MSQSDAAEQLKGTVRQLLAGCLGGAHGRLSSLWTNQQDHSAAFNLDRVPAIVIGLVTGVAYIALFYIGPRLFVAEPDRQLLWLSVYSSFYMTWVVTLARLTSRTVQSKLEDDIIPSLSPETCRYIDTALRQRFPRGRVTTISALIAIGGTLLSILSLDAETRAHWGQVLWWAPGWILLFFTAARVTIVARFYGLFAENLGREQPKLYAIEPADSVLVRDISSVGRTMLLFWIGVSLSIAILMLFAVLSDGNLGTLKSLHDYMKLPLAPFALVVVPISITFSFFLATWVFLRSENAIAVAVAAVSRTTLLSIEASMRDLIGRVARLDEIESKRLASLRELHVAVVKAGTYRSFFLRAVSVAMSLVGPITLLANLFGK
jgi:hypothetical protein